MFITLEGVEGSGKSTQAERLAERLRVAGHAARHTREPGGTALAGALRALLLHPEAAVAALAAAHLIASADIASAEMSEAMLPVTELFIFAAARAQHVARIRAWLAAGEVVVCDRFADTTRAYQGYGRGLDQASIVAVERLATGGLHPDLTLLCDLPAAEGQRRKRAAHTAGGEWNRLDAEVLAFHDRVRAGYLALASAEPARWVVLDARQAPSALAEDVWAAVSARLTPG
jgi:dTMP kinase